MKIEKFTFFVILVEVFLNSFFFIFVWMLGCRGVLNIGVLFGCVLLIELDLV